jgi:hypothetical protein
MLWGFFQNAFALLSGGRQFALVALPDRLLQISIQPRRILRMLL